MRVRVLVAGLLVAFLAGSLLGVQTAALPLIKEDDGLYGHPYLAGVLVVQNGEKKILWDVDAPSSDDIVTGTSMDSTQTTEFELQNQINDPFGFCVYRTWDRINPNVGIDPLFSLNTRDQPCSVVEPYAGGTEIVPPNVYFDDFTSEPLPRQIIMDVRYGFWIDLFLKKNPAIDHKPCEKREVSFPLESRDLATATWIEPSMDVELRVGDKLIGGSYHWSLGGGWSRTPAPEGYGGCHYWSSTEQLVLEKGTQITLRVRHVQEQYAYAYGLSGNHRSSIAIWELEPDEVLYLHPELLSREPTAPGGGDGGPGDGSTCGPAGTPAVQGVGVGALAPLGLPALFGRRGRNRRMILASSIILAFALAGCTSAAPKGAGPSVAPTGTVAAVDLVDDCQGLLTVTGKGSLYGQVHDDIHQAIEKVHVSLAGHPEFAETDRAGEFHFVNLTAGIYHMRFDHADYKTFEADVKVEVRKVTKPTIELALKVSKAKEERRHDHDYWNGATELSMAPVTLSPKCESGPTGKCQMPPMEVWLHQAQNPAQANTVYPGTDLMTVTLHWEPSKLRIGRLGLNGMAARGPDVPFVMPLRPDWTDQGHALYSNWHGGLSWPVDEGLNWQDRRDTDAAGYDWGEITVTTRLHRGGPIGLNEPHPDHWQGQNMIQRMTDRDVWLRPKEMKDVEWPADIVAPELAPCPQDTVPEAGAERACGRFSYEQVGKWWWGNPIPQGTRMVEVVISQDRATPSYRPILWYKDASIPPYDSDWETLYHYKQATQYSANDLKTVFRIPLTEEMADDYYAWSSNWGWTFRLSDETAAWLDYEAGTATNILEGGGLKYTFNIFAYQVPP